jgi:hypothetical protein
VVLFRRGDAPAVLAVALLAAGVANPLLVGGDYFGHWRILQPHWLLMLVPIASAIVALAPARARRVWLAGAGTALAAAALISGPTAWRPFEPGIFVNFPVAAQGRQIGRLLNEVFPPSDRPMIGVLAAGGLPYAYQGASFDLLGMNDLEMAHATRTRRGELHGHSAFHAPVLLRRPPDIIPLNLSPVSAPVFPTTLDRPEMLDARSLERFHDLFLRVAISNEAWVTRGLALSAWARRDWFATRRGRFLIREIVPAPGGWAYR